MNETSVITKYRKRFELLHPKAFFYKIPDGYFERGKVKVNNQRPFDVFAVADGQAYAKEFKFQKGGLSFNIKGKVPPHQIEGLVSASRGGAIATIVIGWLPTKQYDWYDKLAMLMFEIPIDVVVSTEKFEFKELMKTPYWLEKVN